MLNISKPSDSNSTDNSLNICSKISNNKTAVDVSKYNEENEINFLSFSFAIGISLNIATIRIGSKYIYTLIQWRGLSSDVSR